MRLARRAASSTCAGSAPGSSLMWTYPPKPSRRRSRSSVASMRSVARVGRPGTPEVRNRPEARPLRWTSMNVRAVSSGEIDTRGTLPPQKVGQYPHDSEHALVCITRMRFVEPPPGSPTAAIPTDASGCLPTGAGAARRDGRRSRGTPSRSPRVGPTRRTKRVVDARPSGTPRSTSGIQNCASAAAIRKSQASVSPQPPPTAWPLMAQRVICSRPSSVVLTRSKSRRNCDLRVAIAWRRSSADIELFSLASAPAEKDRRRARDDHQAHGGVVAQLAEGATQVGQHGVAQRVAAIGTIQGHRGHGAVAVEADVVAHARRDIIGAPMSEQIVWRPTAEYVERAKITRLMRRLGVDTLDELQRRSVDDPEWYWRGVIEDLGIRFTKPFSRVLDATRGPAWPRWFPDGRLNFADNCVDRHLDAGRGGKPAIVWEGDDGSSRTLTYAELAAEVNRLANALKALGVGPGDRVGIFLPMSPEAAIATPAVLPRGAGHPPRFPG